MTGFDPDLRAAPGTASGQLDLVFPYTGETFCSVPAIDAGTITEAIAAGHEAAGEFARVPAWRRTELLMRTAGLLGERREELARDLIHEAGKPVWEAEREVNRTLRTLRLSAEEAGRIGGEIVPLDSDAAGSGRYGETRRFPLGLVAAITPFNSPLNLVAHKVGPALAAGNAVVLKPSELTPLGALSVGAAITAAAEELDLPANLVSILLARPEDSAPLVEDSRIAALSFTGSRPTGWELARRAIPKPSTLELGGVGSVIVHRDANLDLAAERIVLGAFLHAGQVCASVQRVLVEESVCEPLLERIVRLTGALAVGDPRDAAVTIGPLISESAAERVEGMVERSLEAGARIACGGGRRGALMTPTVLTDVTNGMPVVDDEVFGPVVAAEPYTDLERAFTEAEAGGSGLQAGVFTASIDVANRAFRRIRVGGVIINDINGWRVDHMPFGGTCLSGQGREGVKYAIENLTTPRLLVLNPDPEGNHA